MAKDTGPKLEFWATSKNGQIEVAVKTFAFRDKPATVYGGSDTYPMEVEIGAFALSPTNEMTAQSFPYPTGSHTHIYLMVEGAPSLRKEMPKKSEAGITAVIKTPMHQTSDTSCEVEICADVTFGSIEPMVVRNAAGVEIGRGTLVTVAATVADPQIVKIEVPVTANEIAIESGGKTIHNFAFWR